MPRRDKYDDAKLEQIAKVQTKKNAKRKARRRKAK